MIIKPLKKLEEGTKKIKNGDLDFNIISTSKDELGRVCNSFEKMRVELKSSIEKQVQYEENRKELISNISHDLKTPITAIKGYSQGIIDGVANTEEKRDRYLQVIYAKSKDMDRLIDQLFLFSKLDLNRLPFEMKVVAAKPYFDHFIEDIEVELQVMGIHLSYKNQIDEETKIIVDEQNLKRALTNIVQNSVKYMKKDHKKIDIHIEEIGDTIEVCIRDNGIGIKANEIEFIFDKFYRCDKSRNSEIGGSGIGLAITKQIIERHNGKIHASSEYGKYTSICFTLKKGGSVL
jgi:signal transduction histidine kinase